MAKRPSEAAFGVALRAVDESVPIYVYRVPDPKFGGGVTNWKPCDWMVWTLAHSIDFATDPPGSAPLKLVDVAWFETKDSDAIKTFSWTEIRKSQMQGVRTAKRIGIPYWLAVYWRRYKLWTISDAVRMLPAIERGDRNISRDLLQTRYGVASSPLQLTSTLKSILAGEVR